MAAATSAQAAAAARHKLGSTPPPQPAPWHHRCQRQAAAPGRLPQLHGYQPDRQPGSQRGTDLQQNLPVPAAPPGQLPVRRTLPPPPPPPPQPEGLGKRGLLAGGLLLAAAALAGTGPLVGKLEGDKEEAELRYAAQLIEGGFLTRQHPVVPLYDKRTRVDTACPPAVPPAADAAAPSCEAPPPPAPVALLVAGPSGRCYLARPDDGNPGRLLFTEVATRQRFALQTGAGWAQLDSGALAAALERQPEWERLLRPAR